MVKFRFPKSKAPIDASKATVSPPPRRRQSSRLARQNRTPAAPLEVTLSSDSDNPPSPPHNPPSPPYQTINTRDLLGVFSDSEGHLSDHPRRSKFSNIPPSPPPARRRQSPTRSMSSSEIIRVMKQRGVITSDEEEENDPPKQNTPTHSLSSNAIIREMKNKGVIDSDDEVGSSQVQSHSPVRDASVSPDRSEWAIVPYTPIVLPTGSPATKKNTKRAKKKTVQPA